MESLGVNLDTLRGRAMHHHLSELKRKLPVRGNPILKKAIVKAYKV